jgi:hypothetical protein
MHKLCKYYLCIGKIISTFVLVTVLSRSTHSEYSVTKTYLETNLVCRELSENDLHVNAQL